MIKYSYEELMYCIGFAEMKILYFNLENFDHEWNSLEQ